MNELLITFSGKIAVFSLAFLRQARDLVPTQQEFTSWVESQPLPLQPLLYLTGRVKCWEGNSPSFQAWVLKSRGISFPDYLAHRLSEQDYLHWVEHLSSITPQ